MSKTFLGDDFLLSGNTAKHLYHEVASKLPIIDYHNHLPPKEIAENRRFENFTQVWLHGDHYKWRAMRALGVDEYYITGNADDEEKFQKWAECVPHTLRNPLYHWTHLELRRYFGINELLNGDNATEIYAEVNSQLQQESHSVLGLLSKMNVEVVCTTDDPLDSLIFHEQHAEQGSEPRMFPAFRPDKAMNVRDTDAFIHYVRNASKAAGFEIKSLPDYLLFLKERHDYFHEHGCRLSDHGLRTIVYINDDRKRARTTFTRLINGENCSAEDLDQLEGYFLLQFGRWDSEKGWVQQFHLGAYRNVNSRMMDRLGPDTGYDSIGDYPQAQGLSHLLDALDQTGELAKTIVYNLNPSDNEVFASMMGNFNDGRVRGKMQFGSGWWYMDQLDGMKRQLNTLSNIGLISTFVGMLTDSRSFLSFPRHEYFRRLLCEVIGKEVDEGLLPNDENLLGQLVGNICYHNAKSYFSFPE